MQRIYLIDTGDDYDHNDKGRHDEPFLQKIVVHPFKCYVLFQWVNLGLSSINILSKAPPEIHKGVLRRDYIQSFARNYIEVPFRKECSIPGWNRVEVSVKWILEINLGVYGTGECKTLCDRSSPGKCLIRQGTLWCAGTHTDEGNGKRRVVFNEIWTHISTHS